MNNPKQDVKEIPYTGDFEDSDLDTESEESSQQSDSEEEQQQVQKKKKKKVFNPTKKLLMNVSDTQYPVVKFVGKMIYKFKLQYTPYLECNNWDFCWTDNAVMPETLSKMQIHQRINHFPGMYALARKNHLGRNLNKMQKQFQNEYDFYPRTWLLPSEYGDFKAQFQKGKAKTFIVKPEASCQGRGIFLTRNIDSINPQEHYVAQRYLHKPLLIDGLKFDFRLYVLLAGCDPLRIYIYKEGLARFATSPYQPPHSQNLDEITMHLTNYAINKDSPNFVFNDDDKKMDIGHKRSLESVYETLRQLNFNVDKLKEEIKDLIIKTFCAVQPILQQNYTQVENFHNNMCFEILGFDILIESSGKPYLLEVNHTPSFTTDTPLDSYIKKNLIRDTIKLMNINLKTKNEVQQLKKDQMQKRVLTGKKTKLTQEEKKQFKLQAQQERDEYEAQHQGDFEKIYPCEKSYDEFIAYAQKLYEEWTGANIRRNPKKEQIEQQQQQQQQLKQQQQQQQQNQQQKPQQKTSLYKHVQSKINTNLYPKQDQQQSKNDLFQDGSETAPQQYKDDNVVGEDHQHQFVTPLDSTKELLEKNKNAFQEVQLVDLINYKRISMQQYVHEPLSTLQQQNSLSCLSPVVALNKQQFNYIQSQQAQQQKKNFSIRKPTKPKLERKLINYESDQELDRIKQVDNSKKEQIHLNTNNNVIQNGSFIKPKVFSLKIHHPPKGYKLQSLPILMQQNQTKFRYDS